MLRAQAMKKILAVIILLSLSGATLAEENILRGVFYTNDQGAEYEDTIHDCEKQSTIKLSGDAKFKEFIEFYYTLEGKTKYAELYVELVVKNFKPIDKVKYYNSHYDAKATFVSLKKYSVKKEDIDKCTSRS
jgi:hypothetical protein